MSKSNNETQFKILVVPRFRPFVKDEIGEGSQPKACVAFHKSGKKVLLKVWFR